MKKLNLDLDRLAVESFSVAAEPDAPRGTVRGHDDSYGCSGYAHCYPSYWCADSRACETNNAALTCGPPNIE
jgi:hypothetical protein